MCVLDYLYIYRLKTSHVKNNILTFNKSSLSEIYIFPKDLKSTRFKTILMKTTIFLNFKMFWINKNPSSG